MRTPELEEAWHALIMNEGYHVKEENGMVIRPESAMRMYAALNSKYDVRPLRKEYITKEDFMNMYTLKKKDFSIDNLYTHIIELLHSCDPDSYDYEKDFQNDFCRLLDKYYKELPEVRTIPLWGQGGKRKYWSLDIVLRVKQQYIPIELKFRKEEQSKAGYADDFKEDVQRINSLLLQYDDMPEGYAILLTNNEDLLKECYTKVPELNSEQNKDNKVFVENLDSYYAGVVYRAQMPPRKATGKSFAPYWESKEN